MTRNKRHEQHYDAPRAVTFVDSLDYTLTASSLDATVAYVYRPPVTARVWTYSIISIILTGVSVAMFVSALITSLIMTKQLYLGGRMLLDIARSHVLDDTIMPAYPVYVREYVDYIFIIVGWLLCAGAFYLAERAAFAHMNALVATRRVVRFIHARFDEIDDADKLMLQREWDTVMRERVRRDDLAQTLQEITHANARDTGPPQRARRVNNVLVSTVADIRARTACA